MPRFRRHYRGTFSVLLVARDGHLCAERGHGSGLLADHDRAWVDAQLERLRALIAQNEQRIEALDNTVKEILEFAPDAKLPNATRIRISQSLDRFREYFEVLGYRPSALEQSRITVRTDDPDHHLQAGLIAFYHPETSTMFLNPDYSESEYPALRQYAHRVLYASTSVMDFAEAPQSLDGTGVWAG